MQGKDPNIELIIEFLKQAKQKIAIMESCSGGGLADALTNIPGASEVFEFGAVTYSNEFKIKLGVPSEIIAQYTVYSKETAYHMAKAISEYAQADFGIGITGKLNRDDPNNPTDQENVVYFCIYDVNHNKDYCQSIHVPYSDRKQNKSLLLQFIAQYFIYKVVMGGERNGVS